MSIRCQTVEMSGESEKRIAGERAPENPGALVRAFVEWQLATDSFKHVLVAPSKKSKLLLWAVKPTPFPSICMTRESLKEHYEYIEKCTLNGFATFIASTSSIDQCIEFFGRFGYVVSKKEMTDLSSTPIVRAAWNAVGVQAALDAASQLHAPLYCCFAHDADPVFIIADFVR